MCSCYSSETNHHVLMNQSWEVGWGKIFVWDEIWPCAPLSSETSGQMLSCLVSRKHTQREVCMEAVSLRQKPNLKTSRSCLKDFLFSKCKGNPRRLLFCFAIWRKWDNSFSTVVTWADEDLLQESIYRCWEINMDVFSVCSFSEGETSLSYRPELDILPWNVLCSFS